MAEICECPNCGTRCLEENGELKPAWEEVMKRSEEMRRKMMGDQEIYAAIGRALMKWYEAAPNGMELRIGNFEGSWYCEVGDIEDQALEIDVNSVKTVPDIELVRGWLERLVDGRLFE